MSGSSSSVTAVFSGIMSSAGTMTGGTGSAADLSVIDYAI